jgi:hypothetical protein
LAIRTIHIHYHDVCGGLGIVLTRVLRHDISKNNLHSIWNKCWQQVLALVSEPLSDFHLARKQMTRPRPTEMNASSLQSFDDLDSAGESAEFPVRAPPQGIADDLR